MSPLLRATVATLFLLLPEWTPASAEEKHEAKNEIALFVGITEGQRKANGSKEDPNFTMGIDYEREMNRHFGVGGLLDVVIEGEREAILGLPLFYHPSKRLTILLAPALEKKKDESGASFLTRVGFFYSFELKRVKLAPTANLDFVEGETVAVLGLDIIWRF